MGLTNEITTKPRRPTIIRHWPSAMVNPNLLCIIGASNMKTKHTYSDQERALFNILLDLNYSEPYCTLDIIASITGLPRRTIGIILGDLISKDKILAGNEDVMGMLIHTFTPKVGRGGQAYGFPLDYFTYEQWLEFEL